MLDVRGDQESMDCEIVSTSSGDKESKKAKTTVSAKDITSMLANHLTCAICHEWLAGAHALSCGHMFCGICLANWLAQKQSCPECRKPTAGKAKPRSLFTQPRETHRTSLILVQTVPHVLNTWCASSCRCAGAL